MHSFFKTTLFMLLLAMLLTATKQQVIAQEVINVPTDYATIQMAIDSALNGNVVLVAEGTYYENINFNGKAITVASHFYLDGDTSHISRTIIDGSQPIYNTKGAAVTFNSEEDTTSVLMGFTITGGTGNLDIDDWGAVFRSGGGIDVWLAGAKIVSNIIINNHIPASISIQAGGAGIAVYGENDEYVIIADNKIANNSITSTHHTFGGAGSFFTAGTILFTGNRVEGNSIAATANRLALGGGLYVAGGSYQGDSFNGDIIISQNLIKNNNVSPGTSTLLPQGGGGLYIDLCSPRLENNIIVDNLAPNGAGILVCSIHRGSLTGDSHPQIINNTIHNNVASQFGGGLYSLGDPASFARPIIINSIFWGNTALIGSEIRGSISEINVSYCDIEGGWTGTGENNMDADPHFADTLYNLSDSSSCIGAGIDSLEILSNWYYCPHNDYQGNPRPFENEDRLVDIGALESPFDFISSLADNKLSGPKDFSLSQNYPNPFNPVTKINYQLAINSDVDLSIYNILGQKVATLVSKTQTAGEFQVEWDASSFASGVYLYRLQTERGFVQTKKLILLK